MHLKAQWFFLWWANLIWPFIEIIESYTTHMALGKSFPLAHKYMTIVLLLANILSWTFLGAWCHRSQRIFIPNFVHHHFWLKALQELMHLFVIHINLGFMLLHIINDHQLLKKRIDFVKIKFHSNEHIEWHCMQLWFGLNSN
jgi:hypothetical protein